MSVERAVGGFTRRDTYAGVEYLVRSVTGRGVTRDYRCPGCQQTFVGGLPHVVAWPVEGLGGLDDRRHWHTGCWSARDRRRPGGAYR